MSILDGKDGKPFPVPRRILSLELQKMVGEYFGQKVLEEHSKNDPVLGLLDTMFGQSVKELPENIQEVYTAIKLLEELKERKK